MGQHNMRVEDVHPSAAEILTESLDWYKRHAWRARVLYHLDEVAILVFAALVPAATALKYSSSVTVLLGTAVVILTGLRPIFRWRDDWVRFTEASMQLITELELYRFRVGYYEAADRDQRLIQQVRSIEAAETQGWLRMRRASAQHEPSDPAAGET